MAHRHGAVDMRRAVAHLRRADKGLAPLIASYGHPPLRRTRSAFASLGRAIIYQQLSGSAAQTIFRRFLALFPERKFPPPKLLGATSIAELRTAGVSRQKAGFLIDLADKFAAGVVRPRRFPWLNDDAIADELMQVKGVGRWSVDMFLIFGLNRPDVLPVGDLGIRKGMRTYYQLAALPDAEHMRSLTGAWQPYRSVASWYMWRVAEQ